jgi:large subunit ribosomal protein L13
LRALLPVEPNTVKSFTPRPSDIQRGWFVVDAAGQTVGRLATRIATVLRGKHKPTYTPHADMGDHVIVINAGKVRFTGNKTEDKVYYRHSGWFGGLKETTAKEVLAKHPERIIESAVRGMLPHTSLGRQMFRKLKVYAAPDHPHAAQQPKPLSL